MRIFRKRLVEEMAAVLMWPAGTLTGMFVIVRMFEEEAAIPS